MIPFRTLKIALASTILLASFTANSAEKNKKVAESRDWSLWETKVNNGEVCYIQSSGESDWYIVLSKAKNSPKSPLELMVQTLTNSRKSTGIIASINGVGTTIALPDQDDKKTHYLGIPKNLTAFMNVMKAANEQVKLKGVGGKKEENVEVSTRGFNDMVKKFEERCNSNQPLVLAEFENNFVNAVADNVDPRLVGAAKIGQVRSVYFAAYPVAVDIVTARGELAQVLTKYQPLINELNTNRASSGKLQNTDIPASRAELSNNQSSQTSLRSEITRIEATIPPLASKVQASQKALDQAQSVIAPIEPEYNRITGNLNAAQSNLSQSENRLSYIDGRLRDGSQQISALESEARSLESWLPQKRNEASRARSIWNDASSRRSNYNVSWERDTRLRNNFEYSRLENNKRDMQRQQAQAEAQAQQVRRERDRIERDLQICRSQPLIAGLTEQLVRGEPRPPGLIPGAPGGGGLVPGGPGNGGGGGLVPGEPGGGGLVPGEPDIPPQRDCSHLENALANANSQVSQAEGAAQNARQRVREIESRMDSIERQIDWDVRREYDALVDQENRARSEMDRAESSLRNDENRLAQIRQADIPRLEREQSSLSSERPGVVNTISQSRNAVATLTRELANFKAANDWDRKAGNVASKQQQLSTDTSALNLANSNKFNAEQNLKNTIAREAQIKANIDSLVSQLNALNARALQLEQGLQGLPAERAVIDQKIASLENDLTTRKNQMLDILK
jgi:peptidoglycan hydrolase CwlO-like protein